jgi:hypothetical protein
MAAICPQCGQPPVREFIRGEPDWPEGEKSNARVLHADAAGHRWTAKAEDFPDATRPAALR